jgi:antitoxin CptB
MTGTTVTSAELEPRRKRLLFRAWHRGIREMDLVLGTFADREIATLDEPELVEFETILATDDHDLLKWVTGEAAMPRRNDTPLFRRICGYRSEVAIGASKGGDR